MAVERIASLGDEEVVRQFARAFPDFTRVQGLVLDLRRATDGKTEFAYQILARLTDRPFSAVRWRTPQYRAVFRARSEEHTSELQSHSDLVCRLLLEKKNRSSITQEQST